MNPIPVNDETTLLYAVLPSAVLEFNEVISAAECRITVDLAAACTGAMALAATATDTNAVTTN
ncbi:MAG: hypothetical protein ACKO8V_00785, partial [Actinomycetota bacterium]